MQMTMMKCLDHGRSSGSYLLDDGDDGDDGRAGREDAVVLVYSQKSHHE